MWRIIRGGFLLTLVRFQVIRRRPRKHCKYLHVRPTALYRTVPLVLNVWWMFVCDLVCSCALLAAVEFPRVHDGQLPGHVSCSWQRALANSLRVSCSGPVRLDRIGKLQREVVLSPKGLSQDGYRERGARSPRTNLARSHTPPSTTDDLRRLNEQTNA